MDQLGVTQENSFCTRDDKQNLVEKWMQGKKKLPICKHISGPHEC